MTITELAPPEPVEGSPEPELSSEEFYTDINTRVSTAIDRASRDNLWAGFVVHGVRGDLHLEQDGSLVVIVSASDGRRLLGHGITRQYDASCDPQRMSRAFAISYYPKGPGMHGFRTTRSHSASSYPRMELEDGPIVRAVFEEVTRDIEERSRAKKIGQIAT